MVPAIKQGLRSKQDFAHRECVSVLGALVRTYPRHPRFSDMVPLTHEDPEADFFFNVHHIQLHRRTRAFRKLGKICEGEGEEGVASIIGQTSCLDFLIPLANHIVFSSSSNTEQNLLSEAVSVIGATSRRLSWNNYSFLLGHYLRLLLKLKEAQKNLIK